MPVQSGAEGALAYHLEDGLPEVDGDPLPPPPVGEGRPPSCTPSASGEATNPAAMTIFTAAERSA